MVMRFKITDCLDPCQQTAPIAYVISTYPVFVVQLLMKIMHLICEERHEYAGKTGEKHGSVCS